LERLLWSVADRFNFGAEELFRMKLSRLRFWYRGAEELVKAERETAEKMKGR
jgi:hypothetical protein